MSTKVTNRGTTTVNSWTLKYSLPTSTTITSSWNGTVTRVGTAVKVVPPGWAAQIKPGQSVSAYGYCTNGTGLPSAASVS